MSPILPVFVDRGSLGSRVASPGKYAEPLAGQVIGVVLCGVALTILSSFLTQRILFIQAWSRLPYVQWLVFAIYVDSYIFVLASAMLQYGFGVNTSATVCDAAILLCLACYVSTKIFIYLFLVEKVYIIRGTKKRRMRSKLYLFNSFGMIAVYIIVVILNFVFRFTRLVNGQCIIGMRRFVMVPLISYDTMINIYLTILFLIPLYGLYSFRSRQRTPANIRLRVVAIRTTIGAVCTLLSSIVNLTVLMALEGEPGWVCLLCCNSDICFSAIVIQWITSKDNAASADKRKKQSDSYHASSRGARWVGHIETFATNRAAAGAAAIAPTRPPGTCGRRNTNEREREEGDYDDDDDDLMIPLPSSSQDTTTTTTITMTPSASSNKNAVVAEVRLQDVARHIHGYNIDEDRDRHQRDDHDADARRNTSVRVRVPCPSLLRGNR